ncbi:hypothetical protein K466DRAFT_161709 [Polyporus arcularius HHB13444]|uniref:Uncharacterized protein n=1 Tax=Polyporus arcularius HHB13444 TaxID=1314778 RepID=A0A5C3PWG9_9APHY|nr:hypothetical protein K466DRAFT_161709 [Polyporus arcularius HHB13444]
MASCRRGLDARVRPWRHRRGHLATATCKASTLLGRVDRVSVPYRATPQGPPPAARPTPKEVMPPALRRFRPGRHHPPHHSNVHSPPALDSGLYPSISHASEDAHKSVRACVPRKSPQGQQTPASQERQRYTSHRLREGAAF